MRLSRLALIASVLLFGIVLLGCCGAGLPGVGTTTDCNTTYVNKTVCQKEVVQEPYTATGNCSMQPYEEKDCKEQVIALGVGSPVVTSRLTIDQESICNVSVSVVVSNPELDPVDFTMGFKINDEGVIRELSDTKTIKGRSSEDFRVRFVSKWNCGSEARKPSAELVYQLPKKQVCTTVTKTGQVCQNITKYKDVEKETCSDVLTPVKIC